MSMVHSGASAVIPSELVARLEVAEAGSFALDHEVWSALRPTSDIEEFRRMFADDAAGFAFWMLAKPVTTSLDAALALAERVLPGWHVTVGNHHSILHDRQAPNALISQPIGGGNYDGETAKWEFASTPALALCVAILKATPANSVGTEAEGRSAPNTPPVTGEG